MDSVDTSGQALVAFLKRAADKGLMKPNTANSLRAASAQVLGVLDNWQSLDVRAIDVEDTSRRFVNKRNTEFTPDSLEAYKRRFAQSVKIFLEYADNPAGWKFTAKESSAPKRKTTETPTPATPDSAPAAAPERGAPPVMSGLVEYPFPLREGRLAYLRLPMDLKIAEVKRLSAYLNTLAVDAEAA